MEPESPTRRLTVLVAPDSYKGTLSSVEVAFAIGGGWRRARPDDTVVFAPLADGGEGTLAAIEASGGWRWQDVETVDPLRRPVTARWLLREDGEAAVVELAEASGLSLVRDDERDPLRATTQGTGEVLRAVLDAGVRRIDLGIGGSATTDGGAGILRALGVDFGRWPVIALDEVDPRLAEVDFRVACDVTNPLLGEHGAAATYGPQKGASPDQVAQLDRWLADYADALEWAVQRRERETPGAGAAGGAGFGLLCLAGRFRSFALVPGVELVMEATGFDRALDEADVVVTGEGRIDAQTAFGKTALGVARRAAEAGRPCVAIGGGVTADGAVALLEVGAIAVPTADGPMTLEELVAAGAGPLERAGERVARLVGLGLGLGLRSA